MKSNERELAFRVNIYVKNDKGDHLYDLDAENWSIPTNHINFTDMVADVPRAAQDLATQWAFMERAAMPTDEHVVYSVRLI